MQCGLFFLGCVTCAAAQQQTPAEAPPTPSDTLTLHVTSQLVVLDVVVLDKAGHPVSTLDQSQFTVTENKIPQKIRSFDPPSGHTMPSGAIDHPLVHGTADLAKIGTAPVNILVFDELNTQWDGTAYAREQMVNFLKTQPEVLPVPTMLVAAGDTRFAVLHDYTQSRQELLDSIKKYFPQYPWQMMRGGSGNDAVDRMEQTLGTLSQIAESTRGTRGRKNVIWIGSGYPAIDTTTLEDDDEDKLMAVIRLVTDRMLAARVSLYMVDPTGVQDTPAPSVVGGDDQPSMMNTSISGTSPFRGKLDFSTFATATGGEIFVNRNDVDVEVAQSVKDGGVYYTIAYVPAAQSDATQPYRQIHVALKDPSLHAVTRDGYFPGETAVDPIPKGKEKPVNTLQFDLVSAARTRLAYNGLSVKPKETSEGFTLLVGTKDLHWTDQLDGSRLAEVTVMTVFFNDRDKELDSKTIEIKEKVSGHLDVNGSGQVAIKLADEPPAHASRVRFVVRDAATGVLGTADATP